MKYTGHKLKLDEQKIEPPSVLTIRDKWISFPLAAGDVLWKYYTILCSSWYILMQTISEKLQIGTSTLPTFFGQNVLS